MCRLRFVLICKSFFLPNDSELCEIMTTAMVLISLTKKRGLLRNGVPYILTNVQLRDNTPPMGP